MKDTFAFDYEKYASVAALSDADRELVERARQATRSAWAPYSGFRVGAAARLASGRVVTGSNQESAVYPAGLCAERVLLFAHAATAPGDAVMAIAIASSGEGECRPCGICRQTLADVAERQGSPIRVIMSGADSATVVDDARNLLPFSFSLDNV